MARIHEEGEKDTVTEKFLELIYEKGNAFYGFKDLRTAKEKYGSTDWVPGYFAYSTRVLTPQMAYAIVSIQNPKGITDYIKSVYRRMIVDNRSDEAV